MTRPLTLALAAVALARPSLAHAALKPGDTAPGFTTRGALAGKDYSFDLALALKHGPVVLYFYPKAFTQGCTMEAHAFAEAEADFAKAGARVIGMSADDLPTLRKFSTQECRSKFPVAMATPAIIKAYAVAMTDLRAPAGMTDRTSYVIARSGKITFVHSDQDYRDHVAMTLAAVKALKGK